MRDEVNKTDSNNIINIRIINFVKLENKMIRETKKNSYRVLMFVILKLNHPRTKTQFTVNSIKIKIVLYKV